MSQLPSKEVYKFLNSFPKKTEFLEFARGELHLTDTEVEGILDDYADSKEQKYQIITLWRRKQGRQATIRLLYNLKERYFIEPGEDIGESGSGTLLSSKPETRSPQDIEKSENGRTSLIPGHCYVSATSSRTPDYTPPQSMSEYEWMPQQALQKYNATDSSGWESVSEMPRHHFNRSPTENEDQESSGKAFLEHSSKVIIPHLTTNDNQRKTRWYDENSCDFNDNASMDSSLCDEITKLDIKKSTSEYIQLISGRNVYKIKNKPKGYVLVLNINFGEHNDRITDRCDTVNMETLWKSLDCVVTVKENLTASDLVRILGKIAKSENLQKYDFFVLFVMSEGNHQDGFKMSDGEYITVKEILNKFDELKGSYHEGKPKIFFFQFREERNTDESYFSALGTATTHMKNYDTALDPSLAKPDMFISLVTQPSSIPFREKRGNWFTNAIANTFSKYAKEEDISCMMERVCKAVEAKTAENETANLRGHQVCECIDKLSKQFYLMPGYPEDDLF